MAEENAGGGHSQARPGARLGRPTGWRKTALAAAAGLLLFAAALLALPAFVDLAIFKRTYLPLLEASLERRVDVGEVHLRLLPVPSIRVLGLKVFDPPAGAKRPLFTAAELQARLELWPLFRGRFEITEFVLESPVVNLETAAAPTGRAPAGPAVPSRVAEARRPPAPEKEEESGAFAPLFPARLRIRNGKVNLFARDQPPTTLDGIELLLPDFSADRPFAYRLAFDHPGLKTVALEGWLRYRAERDGTLTLERNHLTAGGVALPVEGSLTHLSTAPRLALSAAAERIDAGPIVAILAALGWAPADCRVSGPAALRVTVNGPAHNPTASLRARLDGVKTDIGHALKGAVTGEVALEAPLAPGTAVRRVRGQGALAARDGEITHPDLIQKIQRAAGLIGLSRRERRQAVRFKTLEAEFALSGGAADFKRIAMINSQMEVAGAGTMSLSSPQLNMAVEAKLSPRVSRRAGGGRTVALLRDRQGRVVVPLRVTGRIENPSVDLDGDKMAARGVSRQAGEKLGSLFRELFAGR
ncbi:MAG TPA: AsmA-like C-terminal region-containing protein [candidate division Zixibacteria bacterium]|nr:AsmA-like C-terminal region-containing protein [candidate division Zixibacteria bacterium]